jgi:hypothetical protein
MLNFSGQKGLITFYGRFECPNFNTEYSKAKIYASIGLSKRLLKGRMAKYNKILVSELVQSERSATRM